MLMFNLQISYCKVNILYCIVLILSLFNIICSTVHLIRVLLCACREYEDAKIRSPSSNTTGLSRSGVRCFSQHRQNTGIRPWIETIDGGTPAQPSLVCAI